MATGRTLTRFEKFQCDDSGGTVRDINVKSMTPIGLDYPEVDMSARNDPAAGALLGQPIMKFSITCVFDTLVVQAASGTGAAPAFSGSHTVLSAINGLLVPLTVGYYRGIRAVWATNDPCIGLTSTSTVGYLFRNYWVNGDECGGDFVLYPGSTLPAWGSAAFT